MQCPQCQHDNASNARYCNQCGTALAPLCPSCGYENASDAKFCNQCGTPLAPASQSAIVADEPTQAEPPTPEAERRQLTVMFCDLADSTKLSGQLDPEDLRDAIRAHQSTSAEVIERYDGYIAQHLGDGLMVYFGWPQAHEDDAQRAVHAGLGILEAMQGLNGRLEQDIGIRLVLRIGIHTGLVVVGEIGQGASQEHLALGETPNIASRIEGVAKPDSVAISDKTYQLIQGYFVFEDLGLHTMKGLDEPQHVYRVVKESDAQNRLDIAAIRGLTPLVGRESEVTLLQDRWQQVKEGQGQVVLLSGEAGIGKSRLLQVMKAHVDGEGHSRLECRCSPYYQSTALHPITDLLQRSLMWLKDDTPEEKLDKLEQSLLQYRLQLEETVPLFATLLSLSLAEGRYPSLALSPQRQRQRMLETIVNMLLKQTERQPVLFIVEDLHWADPSTLELLELLMEQAPTAAICVLLTCRPAFRAPWSGRSYVTQMTLNHLSRHQVEEIAERVAGGKRLPGDLLQQIVERTDGVPLFVEEMTKAVLESEALKEANGQYELVGTLSSLAIPSTLQDSLMARLDRLVTAKAVAQYASVIGRQFSYALLQAVSRLDEATLQRELGRLVEAELVYQRGLPPEATYLFKHALIVDAAYASLLKSTRQQYHQRIGQVLEERFPETAETQPELLAHHYTEAGLIEPAVGYWQQAGDRAIQRSANQEAIDHLTTGLRLLQSLPETLSRHQQELLLQTTFGAASHMIRGQAAPEVEAAYSRALLLCQLLGNTRDVAPVLFGLWRFYLAAPDFPLARQISEELLDLAERGNETTLCVVAHYAMGCTCLFMGELHAAHSHLKQGIALYQPAQRTAPMYRAGQDPGVACRGHAALTLWLQGYPDQALAHAHDALALATELAHPFSIAFALCVVAIAHQFRGDRQHVHERAKAAATLSIEQEFSLWLTTATILRGWALTALGPQHDGLALLQQGVTDRRNAGVGLNLPHFLTLLAEGYDTLKQVAAGLDTLLEGWDMMERTGQYWVKAEVHRLKGVLLSHQTTPAMTQAERCFHQALSVARRQQAKSWELRAATSLTRLWQSQGKRQEAYDLLQPVYSWFTEGFDTADLQEAKALLEELG